MTATTGAHPELTGVEPRTAALSAPDERGRTRVATKAVEKIAARAAIEVPAIGGVTRRAPGTRHGLGFGSDRAADRPRVRAEVDGGLATLRMWVSIAYPQPVGAVIRQARGLVKDRVAQLAGLEVDHLDVIVTSLVTQPAERRVR